MTFRPGGSYPHPFGLGLDLASEGSDERRLAGLVEGVKQAAEQQAKAGLDVNPAFDEIHARLVVIPL